MTRVVLHLTSTVLNQMLRGARYACHYTWWLIEKSILSHVTAVGRDKDYVVAVVVVRRAYFDAEPLPRTFVELLDYFDLNTRKRCSGRLMLVWREAGSLTATRREGQESKQFSRHDDGNDVSVCLQVSGK